MSPQIVPASDLKMNTHNYRAVSKTTKSPTKSLLSPINLWLNETSNRLTCSLRLPPEVLGLSCLQVYRKPRRCTPGGRSCTPWVLKTNANTMLSSNKKGSMLPLVRLHNSLFLDSSLLSQYVNCMQHLHSQFNQLHTEIHNKDDNTKTHKRLFDKPLRPPSFFQNKLLQYHKTHTIVSQATSPLPANPSKYFWSPSLTINSTKKHLLYHTKHAAPLKDQAPESQQDSAALPSGTSQAARISWRSSADFWRLSPLVSVDMLRVWDPLDESQEKTMVSNSQWNNLNLLYYVW